MLQKRGLWGAPPPPLVGRGGVNPTILCLIMVHHHAKFSSTSCNSWNRDCTCGVSLCERLAGVLGHYGGHTRPQVADRGMPSRSGTRG